jgi:hypothetical protein
MKKWLAVTAVILSIILIFPILSTGCTEDYGPITSKDYNYTGFTKVEVGSTFDVELIQADEWSITIEAQQKLFDNLNVTLNGDTLEVNLKWGWGSWVSSWGFKRAKARITMPDLETVTLSGASSGSVSGFQADHDASIYVSGASSMEIDMAAAALNMEISGASNVTGRLEAERLTTEISGASRTTLTGATNDLTIKASGASTAALEGLTVQTVDIELSGASRGTVTVKDSLKLNLSGASSLTYSGDPSLEAIEISGSSTVHKK